MGTFSKLSVWPVGYFRSYSSWLLKNRRDVSRRIEVINAEVERIGTVKVTYAAQDTPEGTRRTEQRTGISVTPGSSLGRLMRAYIANGGDPLSISPFMYPESTLRTQDGPDSVAQVKEEFPHGGLVAPISGVPNEPLPSDQAPGYEAYPGGYASSDSYYPARQGGRIDPGAYDHDGVVKSMQQIRGWANQDLKERLQDIEWRIIKLCDLREQLIQERDTVLVQAFGGVLEGVGPFDPTRFDEKLRVQNIVQDMYEMLYPIDESNKVIAFVPSNQTVFLQFTFPDEASEVGRDMLGC